MPAGFDFGHLVSAVWARRWTIAITFMLVLLGTAAYTFTLPGEYQSTGIVTVEGKSSSLPVSMDGLLGSGQASRSLQNEVAHLSMSWDIARTVAEKLLQVSRSDSVDHSLSLVWNRPTRPGNLTIGLDRLSRITWLDPYIQRFQPDAHVRERLTVEQVAGRLAQHVRFQPVSEDLDMIRIMAWSTIPEEAALIVNLYASAYEDQSRVRDRASLTTSRQFLQERYEESREQLQVLESKLQNFMVENRAVALDEGAGNLVEQIAKLDAMADEARISLDLSESRLDSLNQEIHSIKPQLAEQVASGLHVRLTSLQQSKAQLEIQREEILLASPEFRQAPMGSPRLADLNRRIEDLDQRIGELSREYVDQTLESGGGVWGRRSDGTASGLSYYSSLQRQAAQIRIEVAGQRAKIEQIEDRIAKHETKLSAIPSQMIGLAQLRRQKESAEHMYNLLAGKLQQAEIAEKTKSGYVEIVRRAAVPGVPYRPHNESNLLTGGILGLLLGLGVGVIAHLMDHRIRKPQELRESGYQIAGIIPNIQSSEWQNGDEETRFDKRLVSINRSGSACAEAYRALRTTILFSPTIEGGDECILITSAVPGEGKSVTAANLAASVSSRGQRTLLLDADLRNPSVHELFGIDRGPGLTEWLNADEPNATLADYLRSPVPNLFVLPAGEKVDNPAELLSSDTMRDRLDLLRGIFDLVIIDTAPVLVVTDSLSLSAWVDSVYLVVSANETDRRAVAHVSDRLDQMGVDIAGIIMNRFNIAKVRGYSGYYYGHPGRYEDYYITS